ncbi:hypothetical protein ANN_25104 [Periplaneta americana]|uniref:Reverse transcriptase domain-containing protein n=1 Tax=Periplaneta americana TaxID=6978 RepID=A0ABQ8S0P0_PERAM|nr:hypothetical protein ANN_25104 [Periplaneta americana]
MSKFTGTAYTKLKLQMLRDSLIVLRKRSHRMAGRRTTELCHVEANDIQRITEQPPGSPPVRRKRTRDGRTVANAIQCFRLIYFPQEWKCAIITAIAKPRKDPILPQNYRPISLLDYFGKILERLLLSRLNPLLNTPERIHHEQFGLKNLHSNKEPLFILTSYIQDGFNQQHTVATFLDIEQAFDTVWHDGLLYKLLKLNIPNVYIQFISKYLYNRTFRVRCGSSLSSSRVIEAGIPQESVLRPTLYSIYVQDLPKKPECLHMLYADDTVLYTRHYNIIFTCQQMQAALDLLTQWSTKWRIKINGTKSQAVVFTKRFPHLPQELTVQQQNIPFNSAAKYLGVYLDRRLTYRQHIGLIRDRAFQRFMLLYPLFKSRISLKVKVLLYTCLIRSYMLYACEIWSNTHIRHIKRLDGIQRSVCRQSREQTMTSEDDDEDDDDDDEDDDDEDDDDVIYFRPQWSSSKALFSILKGEKFAPATGSNPGPLFYVPIAVTTELRRKGKNIRGGGFDPVLWIELRRSSVVRALESITMGTRVAAAHFPDKNLAGVPQLLEDLQRLADDHDSADIVFLVGREEVPVYAHRIILMARYEIFPRRPNAISRMTSETRSIQELRDETRKTNALKEHSERERQLVLFISL